MIVAWHPGVLTAAVATVSLNGKLVSYTQRNFLCYCIILRIIRNKICFYGEQLLAPRPTPKLEDHPLSAVRDCLFNIFAATLHIGEGQLAGTCECDNEPSGSMRGIS